MDGATFVADLFGRPTPDSVRLKHPVEALTAIMPNERTIRCNGIAIVGENAQQMLLGALWATGHPDCMLLVKDQHGTVVCTVESIYASVLAGRMPA